MLRKLLLILTPSLLIPHPASAESVPVSRERVTVNISLETGQLLDWSRSDRRIERIFFDNPEQFRDSYIFTTDGCSKTKCTNASMINISARPGGRFPRSSIKVVLVDRTGKKYVCTVNLVKVKYVQDSVITFSPILDPPSRLQAVEPSPSRQTADRNQQFYSDK